MNDHDEHDGSLDDPTALPTELRALVATLTEDGSRLQRRLDPRGAVASRVSAALDEWERERPATGEEPDAPEVADGRRGLRRLEWAALVAAALLLALALPKAISEEVEAPPQASILASLEIERLHPIHLLRALPEPLTALVDAETSAVESDVRRAAQGLVSELPGLFGLRPELDWQ